MEEPNLIQAGKTSGKPENYQTNYSTGLMAEQITPLAGNYAHHTHSFVYLFGNQANAAI